MKTKADLSMEQLFLLRSELGHVEKSVVLAYVMLLGGHLGAHRFYMRRFASGIVQLVLFLTALIAYYAFVITLAVHDDEWSAGATTAIAIAAVAGVAVLIWVIVDACILHRWVKAFNDEKEAEIIQQIVRQV